MEKREVPIKNYIFLTFLIVLSVMFTFKLANSYNAKNNYFETTSPLKGVLNKLNIDELENYLSENPNIIIYLINAKKDDHYNIDMEIKELVIKYNLRDDIVVMDITKYSEKDMIKLNKKELKESIMKDVVIKEQSNIIQFDDGKISDILYKDSSIINKQDILVFFTKYGLIDNDVNPE